MACVKFLLPLNTEDRVIISRSRKTTCLTVITESSDLSGVTFGFLVEVSMEATSSRERFSIFFMF